MDPRGLRRLCEDRRLVTPELHPTNAFYGFAAVLKDYAGLPRSRPLYAALEHGIPLEHEIWTVDQQTALPLFLSPTPERARMFQDAAEDDREGMAIGPSIAYLPETRERRDRAVLVGFPAHSTHSVVTSYDPSEFARELRAVGAGFDAVKVCLYWRDVLRGLDAPYRAAGIEVVSAGHLYDARFLRRLRAILDDASVMLTNEIGSHLFYAVAAGRPVWSVAQHVEYTTGRTSAMFADVLEAFSERVESPTPEQLELTRRYAGTDCVRSPAELRAALERARARYGELRPAPERARRRAHRLAATAVLGPLDRAERLLRRQARSSS